MKKVVFKLMTASVLLVFFPMVLFSQARDVQASDILKEVTAKTKAYKSLNLNFTYQMENPDANINETTEGKALVSGDKYKLEVAGQKVICDGKTIWTVIPDAEEVQVNNVSEGDNAFSPTKMLTTYNEKYKSKLIPKVTELNGVSVYALELTPNEKKNFDKVNLFVNKDKMQLYAISIYDQSGSVYTYTITKFTTDVPVKDTDFVFSTTEFPGFEVIDMR
jgi:outer membrane lipoprotein-sorting protein